MSATIELPATPLVGTDEVAAAVGVHPQTVRDLARKGIIPCFRIAPKLSRYSLPDVLRALGRAASPASPGADVRA